MAREVVGDSSGQIFFARLRKNLENKFQREWWWEGRAKKKGKNGERGRARFFGQKKGQKRAAMQKKEKRNMWKEKKEHKKKLKRNLKFPMCY